MTSNEPFFQGHFPDHPVMPGVLIIEAMAQTGGILVLNEFDNPEDYVAYFVTIDKVKFRKIVVPGDQLRFNMKLKKSRAGISQIEGKAYVGDKVVCEGVLKAKISKKKNE